MSRVDGKATTHDMSYVGAATAAAARAAMPRRERMKTIVCEGLRVGLVKDGGVRKGGLCKVLSEGGVEVRGWRRM
jgi:hypothetical protein